MNCRSYNENRQIDAKQSGSITKFLNIFCSTLFVQPKHKLPDALCGGTMYSIYWLLVTVVTVLLTSQTYVLVLQVNGPSALCRYTTTGHISTNDACWGLNMQPQTTRRTFQPRQDAVCLFVLVLRPFRSCITQNTFLVCLSGLIRNYAPNCLLVRLDPKT